MIYNETVTALGFDPLAERTGVLEPEPSRPVAESDETAQPEAADNTQPLYTRSKQSFPTAG